MKATTERRLAIREFISWKCHTSIPELMKEFAVSKSTILHDQDALAEITSYYTSKRSTKSRPSKVRLHAKKTFPFPRKCFFVAIFRQLTLLTARNVQF